MNDNFTNWVFLICFLAMVLGAFRGYLTTESEATKALHTQGFTDCELTDTAYVFVAWRGCGSDAARYDFRATNPIGKRVNVSVCVGWPFKGATVRTEY